MTPLGLRRATIGHPEATVRAAARLPCVSVRSNISQPGLGELVTFWLVDPASLESLPPPLTDSQVAAIHRRLVVSAN
jgi:hypothetical protein